MIKFHIFLLICSMCSGKIHFPGNYYPDYKRHHHNRIDTTHVTTENYMFQKEAEVAKVEIMLYYETLCPASVEFLTRQLKPVVEVLGSHLDVQLVPFGHAEVRRLRSHRYRLSCQHGPPECFGNKLHACAIHALNNATAAVLFNSCLMKNTQFDYLSGQYDFHTALNLCGSEHSIKADLVGQCATSRLGAELLKGYGDMTRAVHPRYVPYVLIDGSTERQEQAYSNLMMTVCSILRPMPSPCMLWR